MECTLDVQTEAEVRALYGSVECEQPNNAISRFAGTLKLNVTTAEGAKKVSLEA
jgi:hypothetical protein